MKGKLAALVSMALLSGTAVAADWTAFKALDTDGSGRISRPEWQKNVGKLKLDPAPAFTAMDVDNNNGVDENEWAAAEKLTKGYSERCNKADGSWCKDPS